jgi:hypothetical protein
MQKNPDRPYQLVVSCGASSAPQLDGVKVIDLAVAANTPEEGQQAHPVLAALAASSLNSGDVRSRILFMLDPAVAPLAAVSSYAAFVAFCGRRVDASRGADRVDAAALELQMRNSADAGKLASLELVVIGDGEIPAELATEAFHRTSATWTPEDYSAIHQAKRALLFLSEDTFASVGSFIAVSALRARNDVERFPVVALNGDVVDTDELRKLAVEVRRSQRAETSAHLAPKASLPSRSRDMLAACAVPVEAVMVALGSTTPGEGLWHCPRPKRHANGDANASMRVERGKGRCFRCDAERVDSVRLVADARSWSADEAAEWILKEVAPKAEALVASVADRLPRPDAEGADAAE